MRLNNRMGKMICERLIFARAGIFEGCKVANRQAIGKAPPIHSVNLSRGQGSSIHDVYGIGNSRASDTVSHCCGDAMKRTLPLRVNQRVAPLASQVVATAIVVLTSWAT